MEREQNANLQLKEITETLTILYGFRKFRL